MHGPLRAAVWLMTALMVLVAPMPAAAQQPDWQPGPGAVGEETYAGFIDAPTANATVSTNGFVVNGWFVDQTAQGWAGADDIQVFVGAMGSGGTMLAKAQIGQSRPDVATALGNPYWVRSGFSAFVPAGALPAGPQTLNVYAHTPAKGWWFKSVQVTASASAPGATSPTTPTTPGQVSGAVPPVVGIELPEPNQRIGTRDEFEMVGYALDPNAQRGQGVQNTGINRVEVYMDGERDAGGVFLGEAELAFSSIPAETKYGSQFASAGWRLRFKPTQFKADVHTLYVYARSVVSGKETFETRGFEIYEN